MNTLRINEIKRIGSYRLEYSYTVTGEWERYFNPSESMWVEYSEPVDDVPDSIAVLPLVGNVLILASLMDAQIEVKEIDKDFYECVEKVIHGYEQVMPEHVRFKSKELICAVNVVDNPLKESGKKGNLVYFSGGLDATSSMITHLPENPTLVSVWGADIPWNQEEIWKTVLRMNQEAAGQHGLKLLTIHSNLRTMYQDDNINTYSYDLVHEWWWPAFHHSVAMMCLSAPVACRKREKLYFGSAFSEKCKKEWGSYVLASDPAIDNQVRFCGCQVVNDGYEFTRVDKCRRIGEYYAKRGIKPFIRVCYMSNTGKNCGKCEKCIRTIMALDIAGYDPCDFGFTYDKAELPGNFAAGLQRMAQTGKFPFLAAYKEIHSAYREKYTFEQVPPILRLFYETDIEHLADFLCSKYFEPIADGKQEGKESKQLMTELEQERKRNRELRAQLNKMEDSMSWRVTKPLRMGGRLVRRMMKK